MRPIDHRTDTAFQQALCCVQYRLPHPGVLRDQGWLLALSLRYGLVGAAAFHHLLMSSSDDEEALIFLSLPAFARAVQTHVRQDILHRMPFEPGPQTPSQVGQLAHQALELYIPLYGQMTPLDQALRTMAEGFAVEHQMTVRAGWPWLQWRRANREFRAVSAASVAFAANFFERRQCALEEVPEIALLGE